MDKVASGLKWSKIKVTNLHNNSSSVCVYVVDSILTQENPFIMGSAQMHCKFEFKDDMTMPLQKQWGQLKQSIELNPCAGWYPQQVVH